MRKILFILRKEFVQIFRHRVMLPMIFLMPIIQLLILAHAADFEIRNINVHIIDNDLSTFSRRLVGKFEASKHFNIVNASFSPKDGLRDLETGK